MAQASSARRLLSTGEAAAELGVHERTLRRYIACGQLGYRRLPSGHYRIPREAINEFWRRNAAEEADRKARVAGEAHSGGSTRQPAAPRRSRRPALKHTTRPQTYDLSLERLEALRAQFR
jgi:excisionase family DNA binding protein